VAQGVDPPERGFLWLNPATNTWEKTSEQATDSTGGAYYDTRGDRIIDIEGSAGIVTAWALGAMPATKTRLADLSTIQPRPGWTGAAGGWGWNENPNRTKFAWDDQGRIAYIPSIFRRHDVAGTVVETGMYTSYFVNAVWDSTNKRVIMVLYPSTCAQIKQMLAYDPATDTWEDLPVPPNTHGYTVTYDPARNVVILGGRELCEGGERPGPKMYLWRYGP
jgi:hypothetical protein